MKNLDYWQQSFLLLFCWRVEKEMNFTFFIVNSWSTLIIFKGTVECPWPRNLNKVVRYQKMFLSQNNTSGHFFFLFTEPYKRILVFLNHFTWRFLQKMMVSNKHGPNKLIYEVLFWLWICFTLNLTKKHKLMHR